MPRSTNDETTALGTQSSDCSFLLTHLVRRNGRKPRSPEEAKRTLRSILGLEGGRPALLASPQEPYCKEAVCFTESTLLGLKAHRDVYAVEYGVAFQRELLYRLGANPCLNIRRELLERSEPIPEPMQPFIAVMSDSYDATYEREWRLPRSMSFAHEDVRFVFCPERDFPEFAPLIKDGTPTLFDLKWLDRL